MPRPNPDRVCPSCNEACSPLLRACPSCKQVFGAEAPADAGGATPPARARVELHKPRYEGAAASPPAISSPIAPLPTPAPDAQALVRAPTVAAAPAHVREALGPPAAPNAPQQGATVAMAPYAMEVARAASGGGAPASPHRHDPAALVPLPPRPPSPARRIGAGTWAAVGLAAVMVLGLGGAAVRKMLPEDEATVTSLPLPVPPTATVAPDPVVAAATSTATAATAAPCGWIPPEATEARAVSTLHADPQRDPLCRDRDPLVNAGKAVAVSLERELREATKLTDDEESQVGDRLERGLARRGPLAGKIDLRADVRKYGDYLNDVVQHLARGSKRKGIRYRAHIVRRPEFNAGALPGGALLVFTGLLEGAEAVRDEAELVAVLSHEIAHVEKRHPIAAYQYARAMLGKGADDGMIAVKILTTPLSSEHEHEADDHGLELAVAAQYDPLAAVNLWRRRAARERPGPGGLLDGVDAVLRSHPRASARACRAMNRVVWARDHAPCPLLYDGQSNFKARVMGPKQPY